MAFQTTPGIGGPGLVLGFLRINARYTVRGRRAQLLPISIRMSQMSEEEREEALRYLERERFDRMRTVPQIAVNSARSLTLESV